MLNFHKLEPIVKKNYSFVGIEKYDSQLRFYLPKGFDPILFNTYNSKRDLFFLLYRILRNFNKICLQKGILKSIDDRDGSVQESGSIQKISVPDAGKEENNILYSKLDNLDAVLDAYDELKILSLAYRLGFTEQIDHSKIHLFLHKSLYLSNGAAYIDTMTIPRQQVHYQPTDIVAMYCYILYEVKLQLDEDVSSEIKILAEDFSHRYIGTEHSLFHEDYCTQTVDILKDALELIERITPLKDADYWYLYDAIELFLYGELSQHEEKGKIWGIKDFYSVWESMCLTYLVKNVNLKYILYLDTTYLANNLVIQTIKQPKILDLTSVFSVNNDKLIPDAVIYSYPFPNKSNIEQITIQEHDWDDYSYRTCVLVDSSFRQYFKDDKLWDFKIAHEGQDRNAKHTFRELETLYKKENSRLIINSQLPSNFYSYWEIVLDRLDNKLLDLMQMLNHVFYVAIKNGIYSTDSFYKFLVDKFNIKNVKSPGKYNPFRDSLLLQCQFNPPEKGKEANNSDKDICLMFDKFLQATSSCLNIIDIKYLDLDFLLNDVNIRYLKETSIRKQFVYEYILDKFIEKNETFNQLEIKSHFWIPSWENSSNLKKVDKHYLNGYISLESINFAAIVDSYLDCFK